MSSIPNIVIQQQSDWMWPFRYVPTDVNHARILCAHRINSFIQFKVAKSIDRNLSHFYAHRFPFTAPSRIATANFLHKRFCCWCCSVFGVRCVCTGFGYVCFSFESWRIFFFSCCLPRVVWDAARLRVAGMSSARDEAQICLPAFLWSSFETVHFRTTRRVESVGVFGAGSAAGWWLRCGVASACRSAMRLKTSFDKHTASVSHFSYCFFMWQPTICADPEAPLHRTAPPGFWFGSFISRHNTSYGELFFLYILSTFRPFTARLRTDAYFFFACCCDGKIHHKHTLIFLIFMFHLPVAIGLPHTHTQFRVCGMWRTQKKKKGRLFKNCYRRLRSIEICIDEWAGSRRWTRGGGDVRRHSTAHTHIEGNKNVEKALHIHILLVSCFVVEFVATSYLIGAHLSPSLSLSFPLTSPLPLLRWASYAVCCMAQEASI